MCQQISREEEARVSQVMAQTGYREREQELLLVQGFDISNYDSFQARISRRQIYANESEMDNIISSYMCFSTSNQVNPIQSSMELEERENMRSQHDSLNQNSRQYNNKIESQQFTSEKSNQEQKALLGIHQGHVSYIGSKKTPIFPLSRKYMKTKRKGERGQCYYSHMDKFFDGNAKRYDQRLQEEFEAMSAAEQAEKDQTFQALRFLMSHPQDEGCAKLLKKHEEKYMKKRKWAILLSQLANEEIECS